MDREGWHRARLIPTSGISGEKEAERRATSALLAVLTSVSEFRTSLLKPLGGPAGKIEAFIEVPFVLGEDKKVIPDGLVEVTRGAKTWTALVEVKTGSASLQREQIENYLDVARDNSYDVVLTISNELAPAPGLHPVTVDGRKLRKVTLTHLSWAEILTRAIQVRVHSGVSDPDQAWILGELIRYLEHPKSGAMDFTDMGEAWVTVRESVVAGTLRASDKGLSEVASRWDQLLRFAALRLDRELGADVQVVVPRKELNDPASRISRIASEVAQTGVFAGSIRVPDAVGDLDVAADVRSGTVSVSASVDAPADGRLPTRVTWLLRQLADAPDGLRIDASVLGTRATTSELLGTIRADPTVLIDEQRRDFRSFTITATGSLGSKRGTGRGSFIDSILAAIEGFYGSVLQGLRPWTARAPRLPDGGRTATEAAGLDITPSPSDFTDTDGNQAVRDSAPPTDDGLVGAEVEVERLRAGTPERIASEGEAEGSPDSVASALNPAAAPTVGLIEWPAAVARLDRERAQAEDPGTSDEDDGSGDGETPPAQRGASVDSPPGRPGGGWWRK